MNFKLFVRKMTNLAVSAAPPEVVRHLLKSLFYLPRLQDRLRYHVLPYRFDSPIPTALDIDLQRLREERDLPGVEIDEQIVLPLVHELEKYAAEFRGYAVEATPGAE